VSFILPVAKVGDIISMRTFVSSDQHYVRRHLVQHRPKELDDGVVCGRLMQDCLASFQR